MFRSQVAIRYGSARLPSSLPPCGPQSKKLPQNPPRGLHQSHILRHLLACSCGGALVFLVARMPSPPPPIADIDLHQSTTRWRVAHHAHSHGLPAEVLNRRCFPTLVVAACLWLASPSCQRPPAAAGPLAIPASTDHRLHAAASLTPPDRPNDGRPGAKSSRPSGLVSGASRSPARPRAAPASSPSAPPQSCIWLSTR